MPVATTVVIVVASVAALATLHWTIMGNCCGGGEERVSSNAFQGEGHRLGSSDDPQAAPLQGSMDRHDGDDTIPAPLVDENLTADDREQQRRERAKAAEQRAKAMGNKPAKKKPDTTGQPLRGPNSRNTMTWTSG